MAASINSITAPLFSTYVQKPNKKKKKITNNEFSKLFQKDVKSSMPFIIGVASAAAIFGSRKSPEFFIPNLIINTGILGGISLAVAALSSFLKVSVFNKNK